MAISVTTKIKQILADRDKEIVSSQDAILDLLDELRRQILVELIDAPGDSFTAYRLKTSLSGIEKHLADFESGFKRTVGAGLDDTWNAGAALLSDSAAVVGIDVGNFQISAHTLDSLREFTFGKVSGVTGDLFNKLRGELTLGVLGQKTPAEVASVIAAQINTLPSDQQIPKNWLGRPFFKSVAERAEIITGTEMGRAFSLATQKSMEAAEATLPELKKLWLHAGHPKAARLVHLYQHGQIRDIGKAFYTTGGGKGKGKGSTTGYGMQYPRDPKAPISDVIRCGCTHIPYLPQFGDLETFVKDFDSRQKVLWNNRKT